MDTEYRMIRASDAPALLDFLRAVAGDTDNLAMSVADVDRMDESSEKLFIAEIRRSQSIYAISITDGEISGTCEISIPQRLRMRHRGELAIAVRKQYWGTGIAQHLYDYAISEAKERGITKVSLSVRADNERAKAFYRRNGFVSEGMDTRLFSIDGEYVDGERFGLIL